MSTQNFLWLAGVISAHPDKKVFGRTRLQKEIKLLQSVGFPTDYSYTIHFYGPYSEELYTDIGMLEVLGLIKETEQSSSAGNTYFVIESRDTELVEDVSAYRDVIAKLADTDSTVLELAATYNSYREGGGVHKEALRRLKRKKGEKCTEQNVHEALTLLDNLGLAAI